MKQKLSLYKLKIKWRHKILLIAVLAFFPFPGKTASAASLNLSPLEQKVNVGQSFSIGVYVSSTDQAMNAASGVITFPADKLQIISLSKSGSIVSLWGQEPAFSNSAGEVNFSGIVLNPGFKGSGGKILGITFKAKTDGVANFNFSSGEILANDGMGSNILSSLGSAKVALNMTVTGPAASQSTTPVEPSISSFAPYVSSPTNPNPEKWYSNPNPKFVWKVPSGVAAVRTLYNDQPTSKPTITYSPAISEKIIEKVSDGIWYFHLQFKTSAGWSSISHFKFQVDSTAPESFAITVAGGNETADARPAVQFEAVDKASGIDFYEVKIGEGDFVKISADQAKNSPYLFPPQGPGKKTILAKAVDKAGNYTTATEEVFVKGLAAPVITDFTAELRPGQNLVIRGVSLPKSSNIIFLDKQDGRQPVQWETHADANGNFVFISPEKLAKGAYTFWAAASDGQNLRSEPTEKYSVIVAPTALEKITGRLTGWLSMLLPLAALAGVFFLLCWYIWHKLRQLKKKVFHEASETEAALRQHFKIMNDDIVFHIKLLENAKSRRKLTPEETKIIRQMKKNLDTMEKYVTDDVRRIKKEVQ